MEWIWMDIFLYIFIYIYILWILRHCRVPGCHETTVSPSSSGSWTFPDGYIHLAHGLRDSRWKRAGWDSSAFAAIGESEAALLRSCWPGAFLVSTLAYEAVESICLLLWSLDFRRAGGLWKRGCAAGGDGAASVGSTLVTHNIVI